MVGAYGCKDVPLIGCFIPRILRFLKNVTIYYSYTWFACCLHRQENATVYGEHKKQYLKDVSAAIKDHLTCSAQWGPMQGT